MISARHVERISRHNPLASRFFTAFQALTACVLLAVACGSAQAQALLIAPVPDQRAQAGTEFRYRPIAQNATSTVVWSKAYGPDELVVHPLTGEVTWQIPSNLPGESFHLGVRAASANGTATETWILTVGNGRVLYAGIGESLRTLREGVLAMQPGDTLVMRRGRYLAGNLDNTIAGQSRQLQQPPAGTPAAYSTVMAEDPGEVILDGEGLAERLIDIRGTYVPPDFGPSSSMPTNPRDYIAIKGFVLKNSLSSSTQVAHAHHVKLIDIGTADSGRARPDGVPPNVAAVYVLRSRWVLVEGLYSWGHSRYKMQFKDTIDSVVRRSVIRLDEYRGDQPIGGFESYCSRNIVYQNNVAVDGDHPEFWTAFGNIQGVYGVPATGCQNYPRENLFERSIALNTAMHLMQTDATDATIPNEFRDLVGWDLKLDRASAGTGGHYGVLQGSGPSESLRITLGEVDANPGYNIAGGRAFFYSRGGPSRVRDSVFYRIGWNGSGLVDRGPLAWSSSAGAALLDGNVLFPGFAGTLAEGGTARVTNTHTIDPALRYIVRLEDDSPVRQALGPSVGATVLTMVGRSGTHYGDQGYDSETELPMWPFPNEQRIATEMRNYSYTGPIRGGATRTLSGDRGFAVEGESLSHYIWSYLGAPAPPLNVRATVDGSGSRVLVWDQPVPRQWSRASAYRLYHLLPGGQRTLLAEYPRNVSLPLRLPSLSGTPPFRVGLTILETGRGESGIGYPVSLNFQAVDVFRDGFEVP